MMLSAFALGAAATACAGGDSPSPLATVEGEVGSGDAALGGTGPIEFTDECVSLVNEGGRRLVLVWVDEQVEWTGDAITFTDVQGDALTLEDGDVISVGGSSLSGEDPDSEAGTQLDWVNEPDDSCEGELWAVHSVTPE